MNPAPSTPSLRLPPPPSSPSPRTSPPSTTSLSPLPIHLPQRPVFPCNNAPYRCIPVRQPDYRTELLSAEERSIPNASTLDHRLSARHHDSIVMEDIVRSRIAIPHPRSRIQYPHRHTLPSSPRSDTGSMQMLPHFCGQDTTTMA